MEPQKEETAITSTQSEPDSKKTYSMEMKDLIVSEGWGTLVEAGTFEPEKAILSMEATAQTFLKSQSHKTICDVFAKPTATLATVKKYGSEARMLAVVESLIKSVIAFLNVGKGMNEIQVKETAKMIFGEYYYLTVADLKVCFRNGMSGKYGQLFDRLDGMIIFSWLEQYGTERAEYAETSAIGNHKESQSKEAETTMPQWLSDKLREMQVRKTKIFHNKTEPTKFANLSTFLESIGKNDAESQSEILTAWENLFVEISPEMELDAFLIYKSNQLLFAVNLGRVKNWNDVLETLTVKGTEIPEF